VVLLGGLVMGVGVVAFLGMFACIVAIAVEARKVPGRPFHMRVNPINILADRSLWTPEITTLNRLSMRFGLTWLACMVLAAVLFILNAPR
jgi:hypothetical protein